MEERGVQVEENFDVPATQAAAQTNETEGGAESTNSTKKEEKQKNPEELSEEELINQNDDVHRAEEKVLKEKTDQYNAISEDKRAETVGEALGIDLIELRSQLGL